MSISLVIVIALVAGAVAFLLGWVFSKVHFTGQLPEQAAAAEPDVDDSPGSTEGMDSDAGELQQIVHQLENRLGQTQLNAKQLEQRCSQQQQQLAQVTEDRDRIRVEHGSQQRLINSLQNSKFDRDKVQQQVQKQQQIWRQEVHKLNQTIAALEAKLKLAEQVGSVNPGAPMPSGLTADGASREQLATSKAKVGSLTEQLTAMQDWAKPLAKENDQLREVLERLKKQIGMLRDEQRQGEQTIQELTGQLQHARELIEAMTARQEEAARSEQQPQSFDRVNADERETDSTAKDAAQRDPLEETHTDIEATTEAEAGGDDLKKITGIGPALERKLNGEGIYRYEQIAELTPDDLTALMKKMSARTSPKKRNKWPEEARRLQQTIEQATDQTADQTSDQTAGQTAGQTSEQTSA